MDKAPWQTEGTEKRTAVQGMFAEIAPTYDLLNSMMSFRRHGKWRAAAVKVLELNPGDKALDVCCGTGDFFFPLTKAVGPTGVVAGVDFCQPMLLVAQKKLHHPSLSLGDAGQLPVASAVFDAVTVGWGLRNVPDIRLALKEIYRVLKPGGRFVTLDMAKPKNVVVRKVSLWTTNTILPRLGSIFGKTKAYTYLPKSTAKFVERDEMRALMEEAGFLDVQHKDFMFGNICMHWGVKA
ncbi:MAG: bifunctional demethylmenaquinone methyltransferase/2-methoxy-6-polyprenyl-1,4-benzoquinol methylase UbiE [Fimbriimonadaceae bacterium]|nr:bifunctional demethylmenaquinone methyltransferase/2-methoxy-6-polyprenyl-1,4-benzoquinol methylase UbiE [Fimbriimonadaceae bacterium]